MTLTPKYAKFLRKNMKMKTQIFIKGSKSFIRIIRINLLEEEIPLDFLKKMVKKKGFNLCKHSCIGP